ncbi:MAG: hypothetical protein V2G51_04830 [bacterium JZ-2024 1]
MVQDAIEEPTLRVGRADSLMTIKQDFPRFFAVEGDEFLAR